MKKEKGFTLLEVITVCSIVLVMSYFGYMSISDRIEKNAVMEANTKLITALQNISNRAYYYGEVYDKCDEIAFKWSDVQEDITQFILMCEYKFGLSKRQSPIIFINRYGMAVTIPINDLDDLDPDSTFYKIYINLVE